MAVDARIAALVFLSALSSTLSAPLFAGDAVSGSSGSAESLEQDFLDTSSVGYQYEMGEDGNPVYTQTLSWDGDPYALEYEVVVLDAAGAELLRSRQEGTSLALSLPPGEYSYNIATINLLGQSEVETGFQQLSILRAEMPEVQDLSPGFIFMDSFNAFVTVKGQRIQEGARVMLRKKDAKPGRGIVGIEQERVGESEVVVRFPEEAYVPGTFDISVVNPGGLYINRAQAIRILYQRPVDILLSAGYAPVYLAGDSWFTEVWSDQTYFLGADTSFSLYFMKKAWGFLGFGFDSSAHRLTGGLDMAEVVSDYLVSNMTLLYKYRVNKTVHLQARAGGGVSVSSHAFDYSGSPGPVEEFSSPCVSGGLAAQVFLPRRIHLEIGADWVQVFQGENAAGFLRPVLRAGYRLF